MEKVIKTEKQPIKVWTNYVEEGALEQARNLANHPVINHPVCLMSDCHQGYGMPIGGVIACTNAVIPNAVGVDVGCLDKNTEFLTHDGWKKINNYNNELIAQYNEKNETISFIKPLKYIERKSKGFYHFISKYGLDMMLSKEHKILFWKGVKNKGWKKVDYIANDFVKKHNSLKKGIQGGIKATFKNISSKGIDLSPEMLRIHIMVSADGRVRKNKNNSYGIELHFKKKRKIKRAKKLLKEANIDYNIYSVKDKTICIYFNNNNNNIEKNLSMLWGANQKQLEIVADECLYWDGHRGKHDFYSTTDKENADIIQYAFAAIGVRAGIHKYSKEGWKDWYSVYKTKNNIVGIPPKKINFIKTIDDKEYCFTVPSGYFLARRNNKIFITGNCGMAAIKTSIKYNDINDDILKNIRKDILDKIPVGMNIRANNIDDNEIQEGIDKLNYHLPEQKINRAMKSIGTLGSGNHFLELQKDENNNIWFMIHSGSRNIGNVIAKHYNDIALELNKKYHSNIPSKDLAFLPDNSIEGKRYIQDMNFALMFARKNREYMKIFFKEIIKQYIPDVVFDEDINIHHNYASLENFKGKNLWIHRKGATAAYEGKYGIIPGSMGTNSYIVKGKGNKESYCSCSHGAGRIMSRTDACININKDEHDKLMHGIIRGRENTIKRGRAKGKLDLSESPFAYKDIDTVMDNQKDLVEIACKLEPLVSIKG